MADKKILKIPFSQAVQTLIEDSLDLIRNNQTIFILLVIFYVIADVLSNFTQTEVINALFTIILLIFQLILGYVSIKLALLPKESKNVKTNSLMPDITQLWKYTAVSVLYLLAVAIGLILLIVPGIFLAVKYFFSVYTVVDKNSGIFESFSKSSQITSDKKLKLLPFILIFYLPFPLLFLYDNNLLGNMIVNIAYNFLSLFLVVMAGQLYKSIAEKD